MLSLASLSRELLKKCLVVTVSVDLSLDLPGFVSFLLDLEGEEGRQVTGDP
jgi:hypothetical protein